MAKVVVPGNPEIAALWEVFVLRAPCQGSARHRDPLSAGHWRPTWTRPRPYLAWIKRLPEQIGILRSLALNSVQAETLEESHCILAGLHDKALVAASSSPLPGMLEQALANSSILMSRCDVNAMQQCLALSAQCILGANCSPRDDAQDGATPVQSLPEVEFFQIGQLVVVEWQSKPFDPI